ncbi:MAG: hypothetical protein HY855_10445 [Burkholderiales bacterium]|nr:hypothetical protein [Burkholderiales bacterium]
MVSPVIATIGGHKVFYLNVDANVGVGSPNKPDDVQLVQFGYLAAAANNTFSAADRAIFAAVVPGAPYSGAPNDPLTIAIKRHQAIRGGTQDGHVSVMTGNFTYADKTGKHSFQLVSLINNIHDFLAGGYPRLDRHPKCPPALAAQVRSFCTF